jgi:glycosyltransferase involved in cell wall biosynthesis
LSQRLTFIVPGDPDQLTGGYLYDARVCEALRDTGWSVEVVGLEGSFPVADENAHSAMDSALAAVHDGERVVIDGLALGGVPDAVAHHADRLDLTGLVHHPLSDETGLTEGLRRQLLDRERRALGRCRRVIVTSTFTAERIGALALFDGPVEVVEPGVAAAAPAPKALLRARGQEPDGPTRLLCVASLTPRKGQDLLVEALSRMVDRPWSCMLAGSTERDPAFSARIRRLIERAGLESRIQMPGECDARRLAAEYQDADVCLLASHYEGYGMVVSEALARGLPLITTLGGALAETAPDDSCLKVAVGDVDALHGALAAWLDDAPLRQSLSAAAMARRESLRDWTDAGRDFERALDLEGQR